MMNRSRLHVGDLAASVTEADLRDLFSQAGEVEAVTLMTDPQTGQSKGFAFIEMREADGAAQAIQRFNSFVFHGHMLIVYAVPPRSTKRGESRAEIR